MKLVASVLVGLALLCVPLVASAQWAEPGESGATPAWGQPAQGWGQPGSTRYLAPPDEVQTESHWYGWQTLTADGATLLGTAAAGPAGLGAYFVASPIIHLAHGRGWAALGSLGLRVGLPFAGLYAGGALSHGDSYAGPVVGVLVGAVAASAIDAAFLAREDRPLRREPPKAATAPLIQVTRHGAMGGWQGTF